MATKTRRLPTGWRTVAAVMAFNALTVAVWTTVRTTEAAPAPDKLAVLVPPLATGAGCITQSPFSTPEDLKDTKRLSTPGTLDAVVLQGHDLVHYWRETTSPLRVWHRGQVISTAATGPGCIIPSTVGASGRPGALNSRWGSLQVVVQEGDKLTHYWQPSGNHASPWVRAKSFGTNVTSGPSLIQSTVNANRTPGEDGFVPGNLEVVAREGTKLVHRTLDRGAPTGEWRDVGTVVDVAGSGGSIIQSDRGGSEGTAFEVVVVQDGKVGLFHRPVSNTTSAWTRDGTFAPGATGTPSLIQSRTDTGPAGLDVAVLQGRDLVHWRQDRARRAGAWTSAGRIATGVNSAGSLVQSLNGTKPIGLEAVVLGEQAEPVQGGRVIGDIPDHHLVHYRLATGADPATAWRRDQNVTFRARSEKVCQLTGGLDRERGHPTSNDTAANGSLGFTDIGYPVDDGTTLRLYFGDTKEAFGNGAWDEVAPDDSIGLVTDFTPPTFSRCLAMKVERSTGLLGAPGPFAKPKVDKLGTKTFFQGLFNVPSSGFTVGPKAYTFFFTDHCGMLVEGRCQNDAKFRSAPGTNEYGRSALTIQTGRTAFKELFSLPKPFNAATTAINTDTIKDLPADQRQGVVVLAVERYREGYPLLARAKADSVENAKAWEYWGTGAENGSLEFQPDPTKAQPVWKATDPASPGAPASATGCVGEMHTSWVAPLKRWVMLYNCVLKSGKVVIQARTAEKLTGPWSEPTDLFEPIADGGTCRFMHQPLQALTPAQKQAKEKQDGCDLLPFSLTDATGDSGDTWGAPYGPYLIDRLTRATDDRTAEITFLMSTWNPYQVVVMRTTLTTAP